MIHSVVIWFMSINWFGGPTWYERPIAPRWQTFKVRHPKMAKFIKGLLSYFGFLRYFKYALYLIIGVVIIGLVIFLGSMIMGLGNAGWALVLAIAFMGGMVLLFMGCSD